MILIPVKNLANAKQRLASILDQSARTELAHAMLLDVLETIADWKHRPAAAAQRKPFEKTIQLGCIVYTQQQAIAIMRHSSSQDKTYSLAFQLIAAKLNTQCKASDPSCIQAQIEAAEAIKKSP